MRNPRGLIARARSAAESLMIDSCDIRRITGTTTNADGSVTPTYAAVYSGKCKIQRISGVYPANPKAGSRQWTTAPNEVHVPQTAVGIKPNDEIVITASFDTANVGRKFRVRVDDRKTFQSAIRLQVEEVVG